MLYSISNVAVSAKTLSKSEDSSSGLILVVLIPLTLRTRSPGASWSLLCAAEPARKEEIEGQTPKSDGPATKVKCRNDRSH